MELTYPKQGATTQAPDRLNGWYVYAVLCIAGMAAYFVQTNWVLTQEVYYNTLGEQMTYERIKDYLALQEKWAWLTYLFLPLILALQAFLAAFALNVGALFADVKVPFGQLYRAVLIAMLVFAAAGLWQNGILLFFADISAVEDLLRYDYYSLLALTRHTLPQWLWYPMGVCNVFEALFIGILAYQLKRLLQKNFAQSLGFVLASYGTGLFIWSLFMVFLQLNYGGS